MMKKISIFLISMLCSVMSFAQGTVPQTINYQGVARMSDGKPLSDINLVFKVQIFSNQIVDYFETRAIKTNVLGAYSFQIGDGNVLTSSATSGKPLAMVDWNSGAKTISVSYSTDNGVSYANPTSIKITSVPYALHALKSNSAVQSDMANDISIKATNFDNPNQTTVPTTQAVANYVKDISGIDLKNMILADGTVPMKANLDLNSQRIINVATPISPNDAVNKTYVDDKVKAESANAVTKALSNPAPNADEQKLQDAVNDVVKRNAEDITQNDQLNNFITLNQSNEAKGAVLNAVQIGFDKNSFNKAVAVEVLARSYDHDNNAQTAETNPLTDAVNALNPWKNNNNTTVAKVNFNLPVTNFAGVQGNTGLQVNPDLTVKIGNFKNAGTVDFSANLPGNLNSFHISTDGNGNLAAYQGQIEPVRMVNTNTTLQTSDLMVFTQGNININFPSNANEGRVNGRIYQITALSGTVTLSEGYKSIGNFTGARINQINAGTAVKLVYISTENAWLEVK